MWNQIMDWKEQKGCIQRTGKVQYEGYTAAWKYQAYLQLSAIKVEADKEKSDSSQRCKSNQYNIT